MTPSPGKPRFVLELEAIPGQEFEPDPFVRLRRLEKFLGRSWGFRCVRHAEVPPGWVVAVVKPEVERSPCTCGHAHGRHTASGEGLCLDCECMGWTPKEDAP